MRQAHPMHTSLCGMRPWASYKVDAHFCSFLRVHCHKNCKQSCDRARKAIQGPFLTLEHNVASIQEEVATTSFEYIRENLGKVLKS